MVPNAAEKLNGIQWIWWHEVEQPQGHVESDTESQRQPKR